MTKMMGSEDREMEEGEDGSNGNECGEMEVKGREGWMDS